MTFICDWEDSWGTFSLREQAVTRLLKNFTKSEQQTAFQNLFLILSLTVTASKKGPVIVVQLLN